jgi:hypothetical protein
MTQEQQEEFAYGTNVHEDKGCPVMSAYDVETLPHYHMFITSFDIVAVEMKNEPLREHGLLTKEETKEALRTIINDTEKYSSNTIRQAKDIAEKLGFEDIVKKDKPPYPQ